MALFFSLYKWFVKAYHTCINSYPYTVTCSTMHLFVIFLSPPSLFFSLLLLFLVVLALFDNMPSRKGHISPLPGNSCEDLLVWAFPRTLCVIECPRKGLPIYMYLIYFVLPSVSCSLHQLDFYCLLYKSFFLDILLYISIVFFSISGSICLTLMGPYSPLI